MKPGKPRITAKIAGRALHPLLRPFAVGYFLTACAADLVYTQASVFVRHSVPEFAGITFHEVLAKSALNHVPKAAALPFNWTVNPYRGCSHGCVYCFARPTHAFHDLSPGLDFESKLFAKTNAPERLRQELCKPGYRCEFIALSRIPRSLPRLS